MSYYAIPNVLIQFTFKGLQDWHSVKDCYYKNQ